MNGAIAIVGIISLILVIWFISTLNHILFELRVQNKQQALLLAYKKAESDVPFNDDLIIDYERFYAMRKDKLFDRD